MSKGLLNVFNTENMTEQEFEVLNKLVEANKLYMALPVQHPADVSEWVHNMHNLQRIVMARLAVEMCPNYFHNQINSEGKKI